MQGAGTLPARTSRTNTAERIMDVAEAGMRTGGYNSVSYRDIAAEIGIKSASVHYHFPQKQDLGVAVVRRYKERFVLTLGDPKAPSLSWQDKQDLLVRQFRAALVDDEMICLCGLLGAEAPGLPAVIVAEVSQFFQFLIDWLTEVKSQSDNPEQAAPKATMMISALEGALILASGTGDRSKFEAVATLLLAEA